MVIQSRYRAGYEDGYNAQRGRFIYSLAEVNRKGHSYKSGFQDGFEASSRDRLKEFSL